MDPKLQFWDIYIYIWLNKPFFFESKIISCIKCLSLLHFTFCFSSLSGMEIVLRVQRLHSSELQDPKGNVFLREGELVQSIPNCSNV